MPKKSPVQAKGAVPAIERAREAVSAKVGKTREAVGERVEAARERFQEVAGDVGERVRTASARAHKLSEDFRKNAGQVRQVAKEKVDETVVQLREGYSKVRKDADQLMQDVNEYVRDNPAKSVLLAAGAGFVLGLLFRRRRREHDVS